MFRSELQIKLEKESWVPGEAISGDLLITTADEFDIENITIHLSGHLSSQFYRRETYITRQNSDSPGLNTGEYSEKKSNGVVINSNDDRNSSCPNTANSNFRNPNGLNSPNFTERASTESLHSFSKKFLEFTHFLVNKPRKFRPGVAVIPFSFIPSGPGITDCFSSGILKNGSEWVEVKYNLKAKIRYPLSWFKHINRTWTRSSNVIVNSRPSRSSDKTTIETAYEVGLWKKESLSLVKVLYYHIGGDTASSWFPMVLRACIVDPVVISSAEPHYIQTSVGLTTIEAPNKALGNAPDEIGRVGSRKNPSRVDFFPQMEVRKVEVSIRTSVIIDGDSLHKIENRTIVGYIKNAAFQFDPTIDTDLTCLLSGFKLPVSLMSTAQSDLMCINHKLIVKLGIASITTDGTKQDESKINLEIPLTISREDQNNEIPA